VPGEHKVSFFAEKFGEKGVMKKVTLQDCRLVKSNVSADTIVDFADNGLWWITPAEGKATDITIKTGDGVVDAIPVVSE
jgi:hypothetical protein